MFRLLFRLSLFSLFDGFSLLFSLLFGRGAPSVRNARITIIMYLVNIMCIVLLTRVASRLGESLAYILDEEIRKHIYFLIPGGLVGGPRAYIKINFAGFKSHRVHARMYVCMGFLLHERNWLLAESARRAWVRYIRWKSTSSGNECWTLSMRDKKWRHVPGGGRVDTCDHGVSRRSSRVKPPTSY